MITLQAFRFFSFKDLTSFIHSALRKVLLHLNELKFAATMAENGQQICQNALRQLVAILFVCEMKDAKRLLRHICKAFAAEVKTDLLLLVLKSYQKHGILG